MREDPRLMRAAIAPKVSNARHDTSVGRVAHLAEGRSAPAQTAYPRVGERPSRWSYSFLCFRRAATPLCSVHKKGTFE